MGKLEARWVKLISEPALRSKNDSCFLLGLRESDLAICTCKHSHTGQCKSTGGCYNELVVAYFGTGGGVKWRKR